jgi:hypothetical protein
MHQTPKETQRIIAMLKAAAEKHAAELDSGKPVNLKLVKARRPQ